MMVLARPVGYTQIFSIRLNQTLAMPLTTATNSSREVWLRSATNCDQISGIDTLHGYSIDDLLRLCHYFFYLRDHPFHHPFDPGLQRDHGGRTAGAGALKHEVDGPFVVALELDRAAIHFNGGPDIIFQQFLDPLDHVVIVRIDLIPLRLDKHDLIFIDDRLILFEIFLQELPDRGDHIIPIRVGGLGERNEIAGDKYAFNKWKT